MKCRHCSAELQKSFLDLDFSPPSNAYLTKEDLNKPEMHYPLRVLMCDSCKLVQTEDYTDKDLLFSSDYAYFSSTSTSWLKHAELFVNKVIDRFSLSKESFVIEVASNDGYLLRNFVKHSIPCLGIEPTVSTAEISISLGIPNLLEFLSENVALNLSNQGKKADLIIGNNVYAHVPNINDFTKSLKILLKPNGVISLEFPHLLNLVKFSQFDTIYHEHFSYLSLRSVETIFNSVGLKVFDVEELETHGGSLRVFGTHLENNIDISENVKAVLQKEIDFNLFDDKTIEDLGDRVNKIKYDFLDFLLEQKIKGKKVIGYGAPAKANTLLNFFGIKRDLIPFVCDASKSKQNKFLPGSHIPVFHPDQIKHFKPDYIIIFPWNLQIEIESLLQYTKEWGCKLIVLLPEFRII
ncbi:C-methyltransferase C-terminal domain protein [Leptospira wolbachii serovar Codice str. CDC]|uniref:C-methyltransferase C-terminal domain protein n=1 Tax=Leptospira wolbachii serovar Codice str. CDC TaxID=1218599 RepID=R9A7J0_9LEPT|nr:class I SAM-dependent methyltransferase [Leptospira wolbachii]EOQ98156.1 C-methyltransferase C-terminal domain protein [Leptospira wolbachii serovar Codice str. CDC]